MPNAPVSGLGALADTAILETEQLAGETAAGADCFLTAGQIANLARFIPLYVTGRYYPMHSVFKANNGPALIASAHTYLVPFVPLRDITVDRLWVKTWGGGSGASAAALGVYASQKAAGGYFPTGLPVATGVSTFVPSAGFTSYEKALTGGGTYTFKAGRVYFAALQCNEAINLYVNDLQAAASIMGNAASEFDASNGGYVDSAGVTTVGTWVNYTTSPGGGVLSPNVPAFQLGFRAA